MRVVVTGATGNVGTSLVRALGRDDRVTADPTARGAYNVAADPVIDPDTLAEGFGAVRVPVAPQIVRGLTNLTWRARLQPTPPGWFDMGLGVPIMDTGRIRRELGWEPRRTSLGALRELLEGMAGREGGDTPPLHANVGGRFRGREVGTGVGGKNP